MCTTISVVTQCPVQAQCYQLMQFQLPDRAAGSVPGCEKLPGRQPELHRDPGPARRRAACRLLGRGPGPRLARPSNLKESNSSNKRRAFNSSVRDPIIAFTSIFSISIRHSVHVSPISAKPAHSGFNRPLAPPGLSCISLQQPPAAHATRHHKPLEADQTPRSMYIHFPICKQRCHYCDFPVCPLPARQAHPPRAPPPPRSTPLVYIGGGAPSLLPPEHLRRILNALRRATASVRAREFLYHNQVTPPTTTTTRTPLNIHHALQCNTPHIYYGFAGCSTAWYVASNHTDRIQRVRLRAREVRRRIVTQKFKHGEPVLDWIR